MIRRLKATKCKLSLVTRSFLIVSKNKPSTDPLAAMLGDRGDSTECHERFQERLINLLFWSSALAFSPHRVQSH